jgi:hypothetical protein
VYFSDNQMVVKMVVRRIAKLSEGTRPDLGRLAGLGAADPGYCQHLNDRCTSVS